VLHARQADTELRYFLRRSIRRKYQCPLTAEAVHIFATFVDRLNEQLSSGRIWERDLKHGDSPFIWHYSRELIPCLKDAFKAAGLQGDPTSLWIPAFVEICLVVGYFEPADRVGFIRFKANLLETEFLLSNLYGMPTSILGFDTLFGGGGIILPEQANDHSVLSARTLLISGRFGTGKTLLSVQLAVEAVRKGGVAWIIPLEQSVHEYLYLMESMGIAAGCERLVAADPITAVQLLENRVDQLGALIILTSPRHSFKEFLQTMKANAAALSKFSLRVLVADPINSIVQDDFTSRIRLRKEVVDSLNEIKMGGTNVILVSEEESDPEHRLQFEQNLADTAIRLSIERRHGYSQRYFEITKSRHQREQRGEHPFSIRPGKGLQIYPSTAAVSARIAPRKPSTEPAPVRFGIESVDVMLGAAAIHCGDVVVLQGPSGSHKTPLGLAFLLGAGKPGIDGASKEPANYPTQSKPCALLIAAQDDEVTARGLLAQPHLRRLRQESTLKLPEGLRIRPLFQAFINPGAVFQQLEQEFNDARLAGDRIYRLMIDNVAHWERCCPFLRCDEAFGDTLVRFLRKRAVTSLIVCGETKGGASTLQQSIIDNADTVVKLESSRFKGVQRVVVRVLKTRGINYRQEPSELVLTKNGLEVRAGSPLLRFGEIGDIKPVPIRLLLHSESDMQASYNDDLKRALEAVLSEQVQIDPVERLFMRHAMRLGVASAIDEVQVWQLDEFQCPSVTKQSNELSLLSFPAASLGKEGAPGYFLDRLRTRMLGGTSECLLVPYFENVSLMAYRAKGPNSIGSKDAKSWGALALACERWESQNANSPEAVFFDFPKESPENFNCLFFEILLSLAQPPASGTKQGFLEWITSKEAFEASLLFQRLGHRAYALYRSSAGRAAPPAETIPFRVNHNAVVWRHWYTTLNQMFRDVAGAGGLSHKSIRVCGLPGNIAIAGEWYLGIPAYSAAPTAAVEIVKLLSNRQAELERLHLGVGLPTRKDFYQSRRPRADERMVSPYFSMNVRLIRNLVENAFSRALLEGYAEVAQILAYHLQRILELDNRQGVESRIRKVFHDLEAMITFVGGNPGHKPERSATLSGTRERTVKG
jgi:KaiC/GvpD/RAD55 family RecA-like ATPase